MFLKANAWVAFKSSIAKIRSVFSTTLNNFDCSFNIVDNGRNRLSYLKKYLITWFHIYGGLLNLHFPILFFKGVLKNIEEG